LAVIADPKYQYSGDMTLGDYVIAVELNLTVNDDGTLAPAFTYTNGLFSFNAGAKLDAQREQNFTEQLYFSIADLREQMLADQENSAKYHRPVNSLRCPSQIDTPLAGDLGIVESVHMAMNTPNLAMQTKLGSAKAGLFGGYAKFVLLKNLNAVGPTWTLKHFKGPGSLAGVAETNTDQVTFAFAERAATGNVPGLTFKERATLKTQTAVSAAQNALESIKTNQISTTLTQIQSNTR
jgi:hypothetical protein